MNKPKKVLYRNACLEDIPLLTELELLVWGEKMAAKEEVWYSRIDIFKEGVIVAQLRDKLVGVVVAFIVKWTYPIGYFPDWYEITSNGLILNHTEEGDVVYGVNFTVLPGMPGIALKLLQKGIEIREKRGIPRGIFGCRIPTLKQYIKKNKIKKLDKNMICLVAKKYDPEVRFFLQNGFKIIGIKENYFPPDRDSLGWGIILEYKR